MNILTFDIEDWFHILDNNTTKTEAQWSNFETRIHENVDRILISLSEKKLTATFFCLGWIAKKYPEVIKQIDEAGHEIGSHSFLHQLVYQQKPQEFRNDIASSIDVLENIINKKVKFYRAPGFSITKDCFWAFEILLEYGIECDCSIFPAARNHGGVADFPYTKPCLLDVNGLNLKELPMNTYKLATLKIPFSGGGYFRLLPYWLVKKMVGDSDYLMTYFHPRDFDKDQPIIQNLSYGRKFKSYYGLKKAHDKLNKLLTDNSFCSVGEAIKKVNWNNAPVYKIDK